VRTEQPDEPLPPPSLIRPFFVAGTADDGRDPLPSAEVGGAELRPFLITAGRVAADLTIAIETQVVTTEEGRAGARHLPAERRDIVELCFEPLSVAEIAARSSLHLGVVRVLVGDLAAEGRLSVHLPSVAASADVDTLLRVIRGLRAIG
jgi:hypothetical protein